MSEENLKIEIGKLQQKIINLEKKLDEDIESRKNWEDAWVKVSNSYLKWNDKLTNLENKFESLNKDFLTLSNLIIENLKTPKGVITLPILLQELKNEVIKTSGGEKEVERSTGLSTSLNPSRERVLNGKQDTNSKPPEPISKMWLRGGIKPKTCRFCGRELILYEQKWICGHGCTKPATKPTEPESSIPEREDLSRFKDSDDSKLPELIGIKHDPNYLNQFTNMDDSELLTKTPNFEPQPEKNYSDCEFVYSPEPSPCATCKDFSNWSPSKRLDAPIKILGEKAINIKKIYPNFNDYITKFMEAGETVMSENGFTEQEGYEIMKEVMELYNPKNNILTAEEFENKISDKLKIFMDKCFDNILNAQTEPMKSLLKEQYEKQMEHQ